MDKLEHILHIKLQIIKQFDNFVAKSHAGQMPNYDHIMDMITTLQMFETGNISLRAIRAYIDV